MTKFNEEFKAKMVQERLSGKTFKAISKEFGVGEKNGNRVVCPLRSWRDRAIVTS